MRHLAGLWCVLGLGMFAGTSVAQPVPSEPSVLNPNRNAVVGVPAAKRFFQLAGSRRVDIAIIGDSNTRQLSTTGHEDGMGRAFAAKFGMYATRVDPYSGQESWGAPTLSSISLQQPPFAVSGAPSEADPFILLGDGLPHSYGMLASGTGSGAYYNVGLTLELAHPIGIEQHLRYHLTDYGLGGGSYAMSVRAPWPGDAFVNYFSYSLTPAPVTGIRDMEFDIPAGERAPTGLVIVPSDAENVRESVGPLLMLYHRIERVDRTTGIAYSPMWFQGGQSARRVLYAFNQSENNVTAMREWMRQATRLQSPDDGVLLVHIMHGGNDANDYLPSLGPIGGLPSYLPPGQEDNTRGIIDWLRSAWVGAGRDPANLFFLLGPYHPVADRIELLSGYEQGWRNIAAQDPQVIAMAGTMLSTAEEFVRLGFNRSEADIAHLSNAGYLTWGETTVAALSRAVCPADFDLNGEVAVSDIFAFLNTWFANTPTADFDGVDGIQVTDIFAFLNAWFAGC